VTQRKEKVFWAEGKNHIYDGKKRDGKGGRGSLTNLGGGTVKATVKDLARRGTPGKGDKEGSSRRAK